MSVVLYKTKSRHFLLFQISQILFKATTGFKVAIYVARVPKLWFFICSLKIFSSAVHSVVMIIESLGQHTVDAFHTIFP